MSEWYRKKPKAPNMRLRGASQEIASLKAELTGCKVTEKDLGGIIHAQEDEIDRLKAENDQLIERCAQVAESYESSIEWTGAQEIAAAIRALKEKPLDPNIITPDKGPGPFPEEE